MIRYPDDPWTNFELATLLCKADPPQRDESIRFYTAARALKPESGFDMVEVLEWQGRDDEVEMLLRELVRRNPRKFLFLYSLFSSLRKSGKFDEARSVTQRLTAPFLERLGREPDNTRCVQDLGIVTDDR